MSANLLAILAVVVAYLIGAIPFAYLLVYALKRVDIRTVGSGNVGATNAGRLLGFRYFLVVLGLDLLKGLLPTLGLPGLVLALTGVAVPWLSAAVALATIVGHNYPVYLGFRGGKGVATSLGAMLALDLVASLLTVAAFVVFLVVTRYVSLSSVMSGLVFVTIHFLRVEHPWRKDELAMSGLTIVLLVLLVVRHRKNFVRIAGGTEPRMRFRRPRPEQEGPDHD